MALSYNRILKYGGSNESGWKLWYCFFQLTFLQSEITVIQTSLLVEVKSKGLDDYRLVRIALATIEFHCLWDQLYGDLSSICTCRNF